MKREVKKYLFDIKTSIDSINSYLGENRNFFEYQNNKLLRRGIVSNHLPKFKKEIDDYLDKE